jgi:CheY-like chemotaxis protein
VVSSQPQLAVKRPLPAGRAVQDPEMGRRHPLCILPAEDNAINQKPSPRLLQRLGYRAGVAANGLEATVKVVTPVCAPVRPVPTATTARTTGVVQRRVRNDQAGVASTRLRAQGYSQRTLCSAICPRGDYNHDDLLIVDVRRRRPLARVAHWVDRARGYVGVDVAPDTPGTHRAPGSGPA